MSGIQTRINPNMGSVSHHPSLDLVQLLFLLSVVLAPLGLNLALSFTAHDLVISVVATLLILAGPRGLWFPPAEFVTAVCFFLLFALLSAFRATYPLEALTQALQFAFIFFIQLPVILTIVKSPSLLRMSLILFIGVTLISVVWVMYSQPAQHTHRAAAFFSDNANRLGYPTAYLVPLVLYFLIDNWRRKRSLVGVALAFVAAYLLIWALTASASRSATAGTLSGLMIFLSCRRGFGVNVKILLRILSAIVVIGLLSYIVYESDYFSANLRRRIEFTLAGEDTDYRMLLNKAGWQAFLESPLIGVGLDNFRYVMLRYSGFFLPEQHEPHNLWFQLLASIGLIGTLAFLILIILWFLWLFRAQRSSNTQSQRELLWAFIASMGAILTFSMFMPGIIDRRYWLIYGLGLAAAFFTSETRVSNMPEPPKRPDFFLRSV